MKPDWKGAPEWAQWLAMDESGGWYWYAKKPVDLSTTWASTNNSKFTLASAAGEGWTDSLEPRPETSAARPHHATLQAEAVGIPEPVQHPLTGSVAALDVLRAAAGHMGNRAAQYDSPEGERSMVRAVQALNAVLGREALTEAEGWLLLQLLKDVRLFQRPGYHADSAEDCVAYAALKAEAKAR